MVNGKIMKSVSNKKNKQSDAKTYPTNSPVGVPALASTPVTECAKPDSYPRRQRVANEQWLISTGTGYILLYPTDNQHGSTFFTRLHRQDTSPVPLFRFQFTHLVPLISEKELPATANSLTIARLKEMELRNIPVLLNSSPSPANLAAMSVLNLDEVFLGKETLPSPTAFLFIYEGACTFILFLPKQEGIIQAYACALPPSATTGISQASQLKKKLDYFLPMVEVVRLPADLLPLK